MRPWRTEEISVAIANSTVLTIMQLPHRCMSVVPGLIWIRMQFIKLNGESNECSYVVMDALDFPFFQVVLLSDLRLWVHPLRVLTDEIEEDHGEKLCKCLFKE